MRRVTETMLVCGLVRYQNRFASIGSAMKVSNISTRTPINSAVIEKDRTRHCASTLFTKKHSLSRELLDLSWLCYYESQGSLYWFICKLLSKTNNKFTKGFNNWRKAGEKIDKHSKSQSHREALVDAVVRKKL